MRRKLKKQNQKAQTNIPQFYFLNTIIFNFRQKLLPSSSWSYETQYIYFTSMYLVYYSYVTNTFLYFYALFLYFYIFVFLYSILCIFLLFFFFFWLCSLWDFSSLTKGHTQVLGSESRVATTRLPGSSPHSVLNEQHP